MMTAPLCVVFLLGGVVEGHRSPYSVMVMASLGENPNSFGVGDDGVYVAIFLKTPSIRLCVYTVRCPISQYTHGLIL
jgi:hypothetical protein